MSNINVSYQELNGNADRLVAGRDESNATLSKLQSQISSLRTAAQTLGEVDSQLAALLNG